MKLRYPLRAEDGMKLLDEAFDKAVALTKPVQDLANGLKSLAEQTEKLAMHLAVIAHNQAVHHHVINQIWQLQQHIFAKLSEGGMDMKMPEIDKPKVEKGADGKPVKKDSKDKPN